MAAERAFEFKLILECQVDGAAPPERKLFNDLACAIPEDIPGVLCSVMPTLSLWTALFSNDFHRSGRADDFTKPSCEVVGVHGAGRPGCVTS